MAITFDASSSGNFAAGNPTETQAHTCTGSNRLLAVVVLGNTPLNASGVTYNGVAMTEVVTPGSSNSDASIWVLLNPASGANNIVVSKAAGEPVGVFGISFAGVTSSPGYGAQAKADGSSTTPSATVNTDRQEGYVISGCVVQNDAGATYGGSGTELASNSATASYRATYQTFAAGANITNNWTVTSNPWAVAGLEISNSAGGGFFGLM